MNSYQHSTWLVEEEYELFYQLAPREWDIVETGRWRHEGVRALTGTKMAVSFDLYAETAEEVDHFWGWFTDYLDGSPDVNISDRETKWKKIMMEAVN